MRALADQDPADSRPHAAIGERIQRARKAVVPELTQEGLAALMGVRANTVARWEAGRFLPEVADFRRLADALGVSMDDLVPAECADKSAAA